MTELWAAVPYVVLVLALFGAGVAIGWLIDRARTAGPNGFEIDDTQSGRLALAAAVVATTCGGLLVILSATQF